MAYNRWLCHHGVKGMKWGVRLYQKKDGSLTPLGRYRYFKRDSKLTKAGKKALTDGNGALSDRGMALIKAHTNPYSDSHDVAIDEFYKKNKALLIKKGEEIVRYADLDEPLDHKRKYAVYGKDLAEVYMNMADEQMLGIKGFDYAKYTYKTKKDLKVAVLTPEEIANTYLSPGKLEQQKMELSKRRNAFSTSQRQKQRELVFVARTIGKSNRYVDSLYSEEIENIKPQLRKKGYDAVVDWNDVNLSQVIGKKPEYPLVVLDPKNSVKLSKYEKDPWRT